MGARLLTVIRVTEETDSCVEVGADVAIGFVSGPRWRPSPAYWQLVFPRNLFEVKVDVDSGELFTAQLTFSDQHVSELDRDPFEGIAIRSGLPIIDMGIFPEDDGSWESPIISFPHSFRLLRWNSFIFVTLTEPRIATNLIICGRAGFFVRDNLLVAVRFGPLSEEELEIVHLRLST